MPRRSDAPFLKPLLASTALASILIPGQSFAQSQTPREYTKSLVDQYDALRRDHPEIAAPNTNPAAPALNTQAVRDIMAAASSARRQLGISDNTNYGMGSMMDRARGGLNVGVFGPFSGEHGNPFMNQGANSPGQLHEYGKSISNSPRPCSPLVGITPLFGCSSSSSYPSGHTAKGTGASLLAAYIFPERFQAFISRGQEYGESRIVAGQHYPLDVMASRAMTYKAVADLLAAQVPVANSFLTGFALPSARQGQIAFCGTKTILDCANGRTDGFSDHDTNKAFYNYTKNYGFPVIGPTDRPMTVPENAEYLIQTRFPYLTSEQLREIIRTTADPSGRVLDDPWSRINLFAASDGYGAFDRDVTVRMDAAQAANQRTPGADFFAADTWRNDIGGAGTLTKTGTGVLTLAGSNSFAGFNLVEGGLTLTGVNTLTGSSRVDGGTLTISGHTLGVAGDLTTAAGSTVRLVGSGIEAGQTLRIDGTLDLSGSGALRIGATATGLVNGVVSGASQLTKSGAGTLTLAGTNGDAGQFTGRANVDAGTLSVTGTFGDTAANAATIAVNRDGTLRGSGTIAGSVTVAAGGAVSAGAATGPSIGTLTVAGDYTLGLGTTSLFKLSNPGVVGGTGNDLIRVGGNLALGGTLNLVSATDAGSAPVTGAYRLYDYGGNLAGGFDTVALPTAKTATVYTTIPGQVNVLLADSGQLVQFFGGAGTWSATNTNLTSSSNGQILDTWRGGVGIFTGAAGTVTVVGVQDVQGLQFTVDGYSLAGTGTLNLTGVPTSTPGQSFINVDRGVGVTIANTLTSSGGAFGLTKVGDGTLTLTGTSTYTGPTVVTTGNLVLTESARLGSAVTTATAGTFVNAGSLLQGLTNAGTTGNSGTIAGAVDNSGLLTTSGTLAGGLTNTGTVTASAGRIDGGINNRAGTLSITGAVTSGGALSNAAGATLSVAGSGAFDLGGLLTNAGSVTVAAGGRLTATAGIRNDGSLAVAAGGTVVDALLNTGRVDNAGTYTADVTNAAGATLVNTGTLSSVSRSVQNAGLLVSSGSLVGGLDNTGTAQLGGTLAGAVRNTGTVLLAAPTTGVTTLANDGLIDLGGTTLSVGSLTGTDASAVLRNGRLITGSDNASSTYAGAISDGASRTALTKLGSGTLTLTRANTYSGATVVTAGNLVLTESARLGSAVTTATAGTFVNAGSLLQGLTNAGTTGNSGTIAGAVDNSGLLTTSGTLAGGLTNTGTVTASAGRIDGGINNRAGTLSITGAVTSGGALSNAAGATLSVAGSGAFDLGGLLTNAGSVTVAAGGRLTATAGIRNDGSLAVAAGGTVVDALLNTGRVDNAGTYTADVTNAAGATLVNTGTLSSVSRSVQNAGLLVSSGSLVGGLDNTGTAQLGGTLAGAVRNTGTVLLAAPTTGVTTLANDGLIDLGGTTLSVGSLTGTDASAVLRNGRLITGSDNASSTYAGAISDGASRTALTKLGSGTLTLTGSGAFSGDTTVAAGTLVVNGGIANSPVTVASGATLGGVGVLGGLDVRAGATVAPGTTTGSRGTLTVAGNVAFAPGSVFQVDATADGRSDSVVASGRATLQGGTVQVTAGPGLYAPRTRYTLLSAAGGLSGQFAGVTANFAFLTPFLSYEAKDAYLTLARNDLQFGAVAQTRNQRAVAAAAQASGVGARAYDAVAVLSAAQARQAFDGLSGEVHSSAVTAQSETAFFVREAILDRLRWGSTGETMCGSGLGADPRSPLRLEAAGSGQACARLPAAYTADLPGYAPPVSEVGAGLRDPRAFAFWGQGFGSFGSTASDGNAARLARQTSGFVIGADARLDAGWRLGMAGGYTTTFIDVDARASSGSIETSYGALYGGGDLGPFQLRLGGSYGASSLATQRSIGAGFGETANARYGGEVMQGFGEVGYRFGSEAGYIEPFVGGAAIRIARDGIQERGSAVALSAVGRSYDLATSTVGVQSFVQLGALWGTPTPLLARGYLGYRRAYGDLAPTTSLFLGAGGPSFAATGVPIDRDAFVTQAALDWRVSPATTLSVAYQGQVGGRASDNTVKGSFTYRW